MGNQSTLEFFLLKIVRNCIGINCLSKKDQFPIQLVYGTLFHWSQNNPRNPVLLGRQQYVTGCNTSNVIGSNHFKNASNCIKYNQTSTTIIPKFQSFSYCLPTNTIDYICYLLRDCSISILIHGLEKSLKRSLLAHQFIKWEFSIKISVHFLKKLNNIFP